MSMSLTDAFAAIRGSSALAKQFTEDPKGTLSKLGVDTSKLNVQRNDATNSMSRSSASNAICPSVGCVVCVSVG